MHNQNRSPKPVWLQLRPKWATKTTVAVAGCPFWGRKTGPNQTWKHYYQSMLNWHFAVMTRLASRNYFVHKSALYQHSFSILEASDFDCSIFPQVLPVSPRWKQLSLMIKASQGQSLELLWQSVAFKLSYSKVLGAIAAPSFLGLFFHTINWNS